ncbi:MAG TPA: hypothetical protein DDY93_16140 [Dehalococcoidia bacterium]|nr:hypothetical protein [Dehalococcoidia bacterium]
MNEWDATASASRHISNRKRGILATKISRQVGEGDYAPGFTLPSLGGENITLSDYRGKRVILFMWASW